MNKIFCDFCNQEIKDVKFSFIVCKETQPWKEDMCKECYVKLKDCL